MVWAYEAGGTRSGFLFEDPSALVSASIHKTPDDTVGTVEQHELVAEHLEGQEVAWGWHIAASTHEEPFVRKDAGGPFHVEQYVGREPEPRCVRHGRKSRRYSSALRLDPATTVRRRRVAPMTVRMLAPREEGSNDHERGNHQLPNKYTLG